MIRDDGRRAQAKAVPILEVADRLGITGLVPTGADRVGACPVCGDDGKRDANRFAINPTRGLFLCRRCDVAGDGLALVQFVNACDFQAALDFIVGQAAAAPDPEVVAARKAQMAASEKARRDAENMHRARAIRDAREIWHCAAEYDPAPARDYLAGRGITFKTWPPSLRFHPAHPYPKRSPDGRPFHTGPCMIAAIQNAAGKITAVHQTWIDRARPGSKAAICDPAGGRAPAKMVRGSKKGGAIRLSPAGTSAVMIMGEGIETTASALSSGVIPAAVFWAGVDLGNMAGRQVRQPGQRRGVGSGVPDLADVDAWVAPEWVSRLVFIQDGDSDPAATTAKLLSGLRRSAHFRPGLQVEIVQAAPGQDLNDMRQDYLAEDAGNDNES